MSEAEKAEDAAEFIKQPLNLILIGAILAIVYYLYAERKRKREYEEAIEYEKRNRLPAMKRRDFTVDELRQYNGIHGDGRILIGVNNRVFDATKGKNFYGPNAPYGVFAGKDASRGFAKFSVDKEVIKDTYDDLSDLTMQEVERVREWEQQFEEKYPCVGKLLRPGEEPTDYSDDDDTEDNLSSFESAKTK